MRVFFILALSAATLSLTGAIALLVKKRGSEAGVTVAAILGGLALFLVLFALCLGFFMI